MQDVPACSTGLYIGALIYRDIMYIHNIWYFHLQVDTEGHVAIMMAAIIFVCGSSVL